MEGGRNTSSSSKYQAIAASLVRGVVTVNCNIPSTHCIHIEM